MRSLIGVDWGTSSLRVARLDARGHATDEREFHRGILTVPEGGFPQVFEEACGDWLREPGAFALLCGMVGSRQGWVEAPYCECPAGFAELTHGFAWPEPGRVAIVPGASCEIDGAPDVMRGEETKAFGVLKLLGLQDARVLMPGTHSKCARMQGGRLESFASFMTGEFYALLRQHSILARTLPENDGDLVEAAFLRGVDRALAGPGLLHTAFSTRTLALFDRLTQAEGPSYLSGLLIGEELKARKLGEAGPPLVLAGAHGLTNRYGLALRHMNITTQVVGQEATWLGLRAIADSMANLTGEKP